MKECVKKDSFCKMSSIPFPDVPAPNGIPRPWWEHTLKNVHEAQVAKEQTASGIQETRLRDPLPTLRMAVAENCNEAISNYTRGVRDITVYLRAVFLMVKYEDTAEYIYLSNTCTTYTSLCMCTCTWIIQVLVHVKFTSLYIPVYIYVYMYIIFIALFILKHDIGFCIFFTRSTRI